MTRRGSILIGEDRAGAAYGGREITGEFSERELTPKWIPHCPCGGETAPRQIGSLACILAGGCQNLSTDGQ